MRFAINLGRGVFTIDSGTVCIRQHGGLAGYGSLAQRSAGHNSFVDRQEHSIRASEQAAPAPCQACSSERT